MDVWEPALIRVGTKIDAQIQNVRYKDMAVLGFHEGKPVVQINATTRAAIPDSQLIRPLVKVT